MSKKNKRSEIKDEEKNNKIHPNIGEKNEHKVR